MRATRPLFRFDPGWLFIIAGLAVCAAGVLLPAQADLRALEDQLTLLQDEEARAYQRLAAHAEFIDQIDRHDPSIIKRLAATQLNLVPEGDRPVLLASGETSPVTEWIDNTVVTDIRPAYIEPASTLSRWASGPSRLWMFGGGMMAVFVGLLVSAEPARRSRSSAADAPSEDRVRSRIAPLIGGMEPVSATDEDADADADADAALDALLQADEEDALRIAELMRMNPLSIGPDEARGLAQQEDTVDLEEDELPARSRTIIDDDVEWHAAATVEHASEVIIEGKEVAPTPFASHEAMNGSDDAAAMTVLIDDEHEHDEDVDVEDEVEQDEEQEVDRLVAQSMLLADAVEIGVDSMAESGGDDSVGVESAVDAPHANTLKAEPEPVVAPRERPHRNRSGNQLKRSDDRPDDGEDSMEFPLPVLKSSAKRSRAAKSSAHRDTAIPFLRYRPHDDGELESTDESAPAETDQPPAVMTNDADAAETNAGRTPDEDGGSADSSRS